VSLNKLKEQLRKQDEVTVLELLDVSSEELVEAFPERIIARKAYITKELEMALDEDDKMKELYFD
jgi:hypothetical protein